MDLTGGLYVKRGSTGTPAFALLITELPTGVGADDVLYDDEP